MQTSNRTIGRQEVEKQVRIKPKASSRYVCAVAEELYVKMLVSTKKNVNNGRLTAVSHEKSTEGPMHFL